MMQGMCQLSKTTSVSTFFFFETFMWNSEVAQSINLLYICKAASENTGITDWDYRTWSAFSGTQTFAWTVCLPRSVPTACLRIREQKRQRIEICRDLVGTSWCAAGGPMWQIYNRQQILQHLCSTWVFDYVTALLKYWTGHYSPL